MVPIGKSRKNRAQDAQGGDPVPQGPGSQQFVFGGVHHDPDGGERFRKYLPFPSFVNTIENYPYPYVIGNLCWEFPCIVPSDWEGQNIHKPNHPKTLEDLKAALDLVVHKQGVFNLVFHPHGWIENRQVVDLIDHAVKTHGTKVKFLNFREAQERLSDPKTAWLTSNLIRRFFEPVGADIRSLDEVDAVTYYVLGDAEGREVVRKIDQRIATLPGLEGFRGVEKCLDRTHERYGKKGLGQAPLATAG